MKTGNSNKKLDRINGKKPRIVMIGHKRIPSREGGVEIVVDELATRLSKRGYKVEAYNRFQHHENKEKYKDEYGRGDKKFYGDVRVRIIPTVNKSGFSAIVYTWLATIRAIFGRYDVLHFHAEGPCAMLWLPRLFGKRIIVTIHGLDWQRSKWGNLASKVIKSGEKQAARYADEIIVLSHNVEKYFIDTYNRDTHFIPNGVSKPEIVPAECITEKFGLSKDNYILFLARLVPEKGAHYLIEAFKQLDTDMKLVVAGGSGQAGNYVSEIKELAAGDSRIIFTDFVQGRPLEELYSNAYAYVLPSDVEGMALTLLEAASYGNCCLISNIPENTEVMGECCVSFEKGNVSDLKDKLSYILENKGVVADLKTASSEYICSRFSWDDMVTETEKIYDLKN